MDNFKEFNDEHKNIKEMFDVDTLRNLEKMPHDEAKSTAHGWVDNMKKTKPHVKARLKRDIDSSPHSGEVSRIMWQTYLSGTGHGVMGSAWKKQMKDV